MDPLNYSSAVASPLDSVLKGYQQGVGITQIQQAQAAQQAQAVQQQNQAQILQSLISNKNATADDYANAQLALPQLSDNIGKVWATKNSAQQQSLVSDLSQWGAAIQNGKPEVAADMMRAKADAMENTNNGPTPDSKALRAQADAVIAHPDFGRVMINATLAAHPDGKKVIDNIVAQGKESRDEALAPAELRTANAKAGGAEADTSQKSLAVVGSTLGALQGKNAKPEQVQTALKSLAAKGLITKDDLPGYIAAIPSDAKQRDEWLASLQMAGLKPEDQVKLTTPDANARLSSSTQLRTTSMNNATQLQVQKMIADRQDSKGEAEASLDADTLNTMAAQYLAGDKSVMQNLGRGAQGAANIVALRKEITAQAKSQGLSGPQIAAQMSDYAGLTAGIRTSAQISARIENAAAEAAQLAPLAIAAGRDVQRSGFLPFGKAQVMFDTQTNDPALKKFATANIGLATAYANAMARGQKATVDDNKHSRELLSTATSQPAYEAVVSQMMQEIAAARRAPEEVRSNLRGQIGAGNKPHSAAAPAAPAIPGGWSVREH